MTEEWEVVSLGGREGGGGGRRREDVEGDSRAWRVAAVSSCH